MNVLKNGYAFFPGLLPKALIEKYRRVAVEAYATREPISGQFYAATFRELGAPLARLYFNSKTTPIMRQIGYFAPSESACTRRVQGRSESMEIATGTHIDASIHNDELLSLNFWCPLMACGRDAPGLKVHRAGIDQVKALTGYDPAKPRGDSFRNPRFDPITFDQSRVEAQLDPAGWFAPEMEPGDVLVFSNWTWHSTVLVGDMPRISVEGRADFITSSRMDILSRRLRSWCTRGAQSP